LSQRHSPFRFSSTDISDAYAGSRRPVSRTDQSADTPEAGAAWVLVQKNRCQQEKYRQWISRLFYAHNSMRATQRGAPARYNADMAPSKLSEWTPEQIALGRRWVETWSKAGPDFNTSTPN
jgi:hypothetical protein